MNPLALLLAFSPGADPTPVPVPTLPPPLSAPATPAVPTPAVPPPPRTGRSQPTTGGTDVAPVEPQASSQSQSGPLGGSLPVADAPFGYFGPHPFAPNPFLGEGYSRGLGPTPKRRFQSDHDFDDFIGPVSNPILAMDPRSSTYGRFTFVNNNFPRGHPFGGGNAQYYYFQAGLALNERWSLTLNRGGMTQYSPDVSGDKYGGLDIAFGAKYTFYRNVEDQAIAAAGLMIQVPTGSSQVFEGKKGGLYTPYVTYGKEFCDDWHVLGTHGVQLPGDHNQNSTFFYHSLHLDRRIADIFYPFVEMNYFQYTADGNLVPPQFGEADGLANYGTQDHAWKHVLNAAGGGKFVINDCLQIGAAYVFPVSHRQDILNSRVVVEILLRY